jgi:hypothetical protein
VRRLVSFRVAMGKLQPPRRGHRCNSGQWGRMESGSGKVRRREASAGSTEGQELWQGAIIQQVIVALVFFPSFIVYDNPLR